MNLKERLAAIVNELADLSNLENFDAETVEKVNALTGEYETIKGQIEAKEKMEATLASMNKGERKVAPVQRVEVIENKKSNKFKNAGEFFSAVKDAAYGKIHTNFQNAAHLEAIGEDGGFLVESDFRSEIQKKVMSDESLLPKTKLFQTSKNILSLPINEVAPWDGTGIQAYWEGEGSIHTESKTKFGEANWKLRKITAYVKASDELLSDAPALESWIKSEAPAAIMHKINSAIISGDGVNKPQGLLNSGFKFKVSKEVGQASLTVLFENIVKMTGRILPQSFAKAVWICNPAVLDQLRLMKFDASAASPVPAYLPPAGLADAPYGTLMGRPILPMMGGVKALGSEGDLMLVDLSYYYAVVKTTGIVSDMNTSVLWDRDMAAFKFQMRIDGHCPFKAPITTENGNYQMSAFVTLEDR